MKVLAAPPEPRADRPATTVLHDEPNLRVVAFTLLPGQVVPAHSSTSTVLVHVLSGNGYFLGDNGSVPLAAGRTVAYAPGESHGMEAGPDGLRFLATIAPRPQ